MAIISGWITLGLLAGLIARVVLPGQEKGGWFATMILGILGALVGGYIAHQFGIRPPSIPGEWIPSPKSAGSATLGAIVLLALWKCLKA